MPHLTARFTLDAAPTCGLHLTETCGLALRMLECATSIIARAAAAAALRPLLKSRFLLPAT